MTVLVLGDNDLASDFTIACQHGARDFIQVRHNLLTRVDVLDLVRDHRAGRLLDFTKPFVGAQSSWAIRQVWITTGVPALRAVPRSFASLPGAVRWTWVASFEDAVQVAQNVGNRVLSVFGSLVGGAARGLEDACVLGIRPGAREATDDRTPAVALMGVTPPVKRAIKMVRRHAADCVLAADTGDPGTLALLEAADLLDLQVVMVRRPAERQLAGLTVHDVAGALSWLRAVDREG